MTYDLFEMCVKVIILLPITLGMIYFIIKYGNGKLQSFGTNKIMKVIEKVQLSKDSCIAVIEVLGEYYLVSIGNGKSEILLKLDNEKIEEIFSSKKLQVKNNKGIKDLITKIYKKEDCNEEEK